MKKLVLLIFILFTFNNIMAMPSDDEALIKEAKKAYSAKNYEKVYKLTYGLTYKNNSAATTS